MGFQKCKGKETDKLFSLHQPLSYVSTHMQLTTVLIIVTHQLIPYTVDFKSLMKHNHTTNLVKL